jgi:serine/threonine protein kinase
MQEAAEGVQYIHSEGIVHGDLKGVRMQIYLSRH